MRSTFHHYENKPWWLNNVVYLQASSSEHFNLNSASPSSLPGHVCDGEEGEEADFFGGPSP